MPKCQNAERNSSGIAKHRNAENEKGWNVAMPTCQHVIRNPTTKHQNASTHKMRNIAKYIICRITDVMDSLTLLVCKVRTFTSPHLHFSELLLGVRAEGGSSENLLHRVLSWGSSVWRFTFLIASDSGTNFFHRVGQKIVPPGVDLASIRFDDLPSTRTFCACTQWSANNGCLILLITDGILLVMLCSMLYSSLRAKGVSGMSSFPHQS